MNDTIFDPAATDPYSIPLAQLNPAQPALFQADRHWAYFERLRREAPVHYTAESEFGPYWSVTKYKDIMAVDTNHQVYSSLSTLGGIAIRDQSADFPLPMFIAMDPPRHDAQRLAVGPIVAPGNLANLEGLIREHRGNVAAVARVLGKDRAQIHRWLQMFGIDPDTHR